jgi:hypothetical protein
LRGDDLALLNDTEKPERMGIYGSERRLGTVFTAVESEEEDGREGMNGT